MSVVICGLPRSGKTTIGKALAKALQWDFIDTDQLIEKAYGNTLSCKEIFLQEGGFFFRTFECKQILSLKASKSVIAIGGGSLIDTKCAAHISTLGPVIYLKISENRLLERFLQHEIPAYLDPTSIELSLQKLYKDRTPLYEKAAHVTIEVTDRTVDQIVALCFQPIFKKIKDSF